MNFRALFSIALLAAVLISPAKAANPGVSAPQIVLRIDEAHRVTLYGNTPPEARPDNDRGVVPDSLVLPGMQLALRRPAAQERLVEALLHDQLDRTSARYHRWITAGEYGRRFGVAVQDIDRIVFWLRSHGFKVKNTPRNRIRIDFSGTAGQVREAFHTQIHRLRVRGEDHIANFSDPQIPEALAPVVAGVAWLNDFRGKPQYTGSTTCQPFDANGNATSTCYDIVPGDLWKIYNFPSNFPQSANSGAGETIVVLEDQDTCCGQNPDTNWCAFRTLFWEAVCSQSL
jgi:hypothetical protein